MASPKERASSRVSGVMLQPSVKKFVALNQFLLLIRCFPSPEMTACTAERSSRRRIRRPVIRRPTKSELWRATAASVATRLSVTRSLLAMKMDRGVELLQSASVSRLHEVNSASNFSSSFKTSIVKHHCRSSTEAFPYRQQMQLSMAQLRSTNATQTSSLTAYRGRRLLGLRATNLRRDYLPNSRCK